MIIITKTQVLCIDPLADLGLISEIIIYIIVIQITQTDAINNTEITLIGDIKIEINLEISI